MNSISQEPLLSTILPSHTTLTNYQDRDYAEVTNTCSTKYEVYVELFYCSLSFVGRVKSNIGVSNPIWVCQIRSECVKCAMDMSDTIWVCQIRYGCVGYNLGVSNLHTWVCIKKAMGKRRAKIQSASVAACHLAPRCGPLFDNKCAVDPQTSSRDMFL